MQMVSGLLVTIDVESGGFVSMCVSETNVDLWEIVLKCLFFKLISPFSYVLYVIRIYTEQHYASQSIARMNL